MQAVHVNHEATSGRHWYIHIKRQFTHQFMIPCTSNDKEQSLLQLLQEIHVITTRCSSLHFCKVAACKLAKLDQTRPDNLSIVFGCIMQWQ